MITLTFILYFFSIQGSTAVEVILGAHDISISEPDTVSFTVRSSDYIVHPSFNVMNGNFDIALMKTPTMTLNGNNTGYVLMPELGSVNENIDDVVIALGWGNASNNRLHRFQTVVLSTGYCWTRLPVEMLPPSVICTRPIESRGPCFDDEGGPLLIFDVNTRRHILIGLISWTMCGNGDPDLFTRITSFRDWINQNAQI